MKKTLIILLAALTICFTSILIKPTIASAEPFLGEINMFAGNFAPRGWAFCDGQILPINQYQALFSILGTTYGGDGRTSFALPDLRGRSPIHAGQGPGLSDYRLGNRAGLETVSLSVAQLPEHTHQLKGSDLNAVSSDPAGSLLAGTGRARIYNNGGTLEDMHANAVGDTGSGQNIENRSPYIAIHYIIALQGVFPSRN